MSSAKKNLSLYLLVLLYLIQRPTPIYGQTSTEAKALKTAMFTTNGYDKAIRPSLDQNVATDVYTSFYLLAVNELNEVAETLQTTGYLYIEWTDQHLLWNASDYGGIENSFWPQDLVWKPDVALKNSYKEYKELGDSALNVVVQFDGKVTWSPFQVFFSTCSINVKYFPFDTQTCALRFVAWSYTKDQVVMHGGTKGIELDQYSPNSAWEISDTTWSVEWESDEVSIKFSLQLKRKPMFIILNMLLPIIMLAVLNVMVFAIPSESGEKAGYAVTIFLAFAVFMTIISETLPENSDSTSIFSVYVVLLTVQSTVITSLSLVMVRMCQFGDDTKIPKFFVFLARLAKGRQCRRKRKVQDCPKVKVNSNDVQKIDLKSTDDDSELEEEDPPMSWIEVMNALDLVLFVFFMLSIIITTTVCMTIAKISSSVSAFSTDNQ